MNRRTFNKLVSIIPLAGVTMSLTHLETILANNKNTELMPTIFVGHGNPMNAIEENKFTRGWQDTAAKIPTPQVIICISAHWETNGTFITAMDKPKTIHDFGGFPEALYKVQYPAPGSPSTANDIKKLLHGSKIGMDYDWGLDHGCWAPIMRMYPEANLPIIQISLDRSLDAQGHYEFAKQLQIYRNKGALIIGSGNLVHNLRLVAWDKMDEPDFGYDWAIEANTKMKKYISEGDTKSLINYRSQGKAFDLAIPTAEHYLPMLYVMGLQAKNETISFFNDKAQAGSLTMTSFIAGN
ncbi:MAG: 4,5-DOPA dioxygenase extradiol [Candidatus Kapabacteria bacterium]|nr:4,5-DOPA dioxygenase extradiol [Candidatus Kapabacteria bacterium]